MLLWFVSTVVIALITWVRTDANSRLQWLPPALVVAASVSLLVIATHI